MKRILLLLLFFNLYFLNHTQANPLNDFDVEKWSEETGKIEALKHTEKKWSKKIKKHAAEQNAIKFIPLFKAIIVVESDGKSKKENKNTGAIGLMGITPIASKEVGETAKNLLDPDKNIRIGIKFFRQMSKKFDHDLESTLAAYNSGETDVRNSLEKTGKLSNLQETREYIIKVLYIAKKAGFKI
ncbi:hypothetical protein A2331_03955 [Candidatus Falkowbacteria bacterium RIFOXYB2_FULL_34_18]|uniref:Transglycosylase SLT domain-containing protein n=1 Tax=Candidatus Falkowbacteria bacterium RIFOXYD2_FULL_34_120 TaxID=1798007 RepID=A0A1F5TPP1_9BACT|nr:MAG: hypothetical protein A2331_03955 [Candidatus Falkowbacteria bacterium RIFOXYB2_FULL_34_18]OGF29105.1 MAG: hypothetical protein A2500_03280 [Candidatus Falkowbacteria bacterium RIFOXYC12_FULL_34_55]OGF36188.1 MAG: hypothetical protein A2466_04810 [Candidatus Falkowbacteria bacterium RIFOXYC2_FULL_34_220]OGF38615.1 MAG: hypothetical protein A2515_02170 [Candidatus Falkowbacteria bacterium RIFOXYD12_FULL_34_57]OGF40798.1 MAG: hypothetical protein A2531_06815 [Candidatus Falkowbacteria bact